MSPTETHPLLPTTVATTKLRAAPRPPRRRAGAATVGYFLMVLSAVFQASATLFFHMAEVVYAIPAATNLVVLGLISLLLPLVQLAVTRAPLRVPRVAAVPLALRALCGGVTTICSMLAVSYIPAGAFSTAFGLAPIFTSALAALLHREPFTRRHAGSLGVNLLGVALVSHASSPPRRAAYDAADASYGYAAALCAALGAAGAALAIRRVGGRSDGTSLTALYGAGCLIIAPLVTRWADLVMLRSSARGAACSVLGATSACVSQLFFALALARAPAGPAVMVRSLGVPLVFVLALLTMDETVGVGGVVGMLLTIASVAPLAMGRGDESERVQEQEEEQAASERVKGTVYAAVER